jgi:hypothetical protein
MQVTEVCFSVINFSAKLEDPHPSSNIYELGGRIF